MKKLVLFLVILAACTGSMHGQSGILNKRIKIESLEGSLGTLLKEISRKGGFVFSHSQDIQLEKQVRLQYRRQTVGQFLEEIFNGEIYCIEYGNKVHIKKKPNVPEVYTVRGKVIDSGTGEPVPGATVIIPGTEPSLIGAVSDAEGVFLINVPLGMDVIRFSCVGYEQVDLSMEQPLPEQIELTRGSLEISEVVIPSYRLPVKQGSALAVSYISGDRLELAPGASIENTLIGTVSGVHVVRNSGMPGSSFQVKIRGTHSLINSDPVYYLDGIPLQSALLNAVSPQDISSVEINKDATSTARYGARAGNGVILLHSKEGNGEKLCVNLDYYIGMQQVRKKPELMDTETFLGYFEQVRPADDRFDNLDSIYMTDWAELVFHPAKTEDHHLSVSGGNDRSDYYLGTGFFNQGSIIKELNLNRYSFKFGSNHRINRKWKISQNISVSHIRYEGLKEGCFLNDHNNPILASMCRLPIDPPHDSVLDASRFIHASAEIPDHISDPDIPYLDAELTDNVRKNYTVFGNLTSRIALMRNLNLLTAFGYEVLFQNNISNNRTRSANTSLAQNPVCVSGYEVLDLGLYFHNYLQYEMVLASDHKLEGSAGFEYGQNENEWIPVSQTLNNLVSGQQKSLYNSVQDLRSSVGSQNRAFLGSLNYIYKERYILNGSLRREVVSFEGDTAKEIYADLYPSASVGWIFLKRNPSSAGLVQFGKLRYAYGMAGNSPRLDYTFHARFMRDMAYVYSFSSSGLITNSFDQRRTNERFYWEKISAHNLGIELGIHQNRIFLSTDLFYNHLHRGERSLYKPPLDFVGQLYGKNNYGIVELPLAEVENYGIEGLINYKNSGSLIQWDISLNFTHLRNKIADVEEHSFFSATDPLSMNFKGETAGSFYGYKIERLFTEDDCPAPGETVTNQPHITDANGNRVYAQPNARAGDYKFMDMNGDSVIDRKDKTILGNPYPDLTFGLYFNVRYRQFDFAMFWQGTYGNEIYNATKLWLYNPYGSSNWTHDILNSYRSPQYDESGEMTDPGLTDTDLHRFDYYAENKNLRVSDFYVEDGSYLRLKNIQLGYTLDPALTRRIHIESLRIYIAAQNLVTFTRYSCLDPEVGGWCIDCGIYPQPRTIYAGVNVGF